MNRSHPSALFLAALLVATPASAQMLPPSQDEPPPPTPMPEPTRGWPWGARHASRFSWSRITGSGTFLHIAGAGGSRTTGGATFDTDLFTDGSLGILSYEEHLGGSAGGGGGGFEVGNLDLSILGGLRGYVTDTSGPFLRAGGALETTGNGAMSLGSAALLARAGYQSITPALVLEGGLLGGYMAGKWSVASTERQLDQSPFLGAYACLGQRPALLRFEWRHIVPASSGGVLPLDEVRSSGCYTWGALAVCLDVKVIEGGVSQPATELGQTPPPAQATATYAGMSLGFGSGAVRVVTPKR